MKKLLLLILMAFSAFSSGVMHFPEVSILSILAPSTPIKLGEGVQARFFTVIADSDNVGVVYIGDSTLNYANKNGIPLSPSDSVTLGGFDANSSGFYDLGRFYLDGANIGDKIKVFAIKYDYK